MMTKLTGKVALITSIGRACARALVGAAAAAWSLQTVYDLPAIDSNFMLRDHVVQDDRDIPVVAGHYFWVEKNLNGAKYNNIKQRD